MRTAGWWGMMVLLVISAAGLGPRSRAAAAVGVRPAVQSTGLNMAGPTSCPSGGCAAGQRFNLSFDFDLQSYNPGASPNVKMCLYAPSNWNVAVDLTDTVQGQLTGVNYQRVANCSEDTAPPEGYSMILARQATIPMTTFSDTVGVALRIAANASGSGRFMARLFESSDGTNFTRTQQATTPVLSTTAPGGMVYVANDAAACGSSSPCYINSADDLPEGLGSGLRDAVQAVSGGATITVLGNYTIKSDTVVIDRPVTLTGINDARITYTGSGPCSESMLSLQESITLRGLNINDGTCSATNRSLVEVNSSGDVLIESNDLTGGDNAIVIADNSGSVRVRFNHISGNAGYAVYGVGNSNNGSLEVTANNLHANGAANLIECSANASGVVANRRANHNYWGKTAPNQETTHCIMPSGKRLGAPVILRSGAPGINAQLVTVQESKTYAFTNQIAFRRSGGSDFNLFIVDHGFLSDTGAPFTTAAGEDSPNPCSNYWDVFLPEGTNPNASLELSIKYDKTTACLAAINSSLYCDQTTTPSRYPLYWFDPATGVTDGWDTTGQRPGNLTSGEGQATTCNTGASEIQVSFDNTGRPALNSDLGYTPLMVAIPVLRSFLPLASSQVINVTWTTNAEPDVEGFYVLRGVDPDNLTPISDLIPRRGTALSGVTAPAYQFTDSGRENGVTYYYRLQIVRSDGRSIYSQLEEITANIATITPTFTLVPTRTTAPPLPTITPRPTLIPTQRPTAVATLTATPRTETPTSTFLVLDTTTTTTTVLATMDEMGTGTPIAMVTSASPGLDETLTLPAVPGGEDEGQSASPWISLLLGMLAGLAAIGVTGGLWYMRLRG